MKVRYNRTDDVLIIHIADGMVDYAEEVGKMIVHYSKESKPLFIEVLDASKFIATLAKTVAKAKSGETIEI